jgi:hypothetical protein
MELDSRGHNAGTTLREDLTLIVRYVVLVFCGILLTTEQMGIYLAAR